MTTPIQASGTVTATAGVGGLAEAIDSILDKGLVLDAYVRVQVIGIDLLTIEARIVISSVDTYLKFAQAMSRLNGPAQVSSTPALDAQRASRHGIEGVVGGTALQTVSDTTVPGPGPDTSPAA